MENDSEVAKIVYQVLDLIDEDRLAHCIDLPIDRSLAHIQLRYTTPLSHHQFLAILASVIQILYRDAAPIPRHLPPEQALAESIWLLEHYYQGSRITGYEAAWLDAREPQGLEIVISRTAEIIKHLHRQPILRFRH
jgi:hypothetical protein